MTAQPRPCRSCRSGDALLVLDLGAQPASDSFPLVDAPLPDPSWPLSLWGCRACGLVQLGGGVVPLPTPPLAVESATSRASARASAARVAARLQLGAGAVFAAFDSHHGGSWSPALRDAGLQPADAGAPADLVVDVHALAHEEELDVRLAERAAATAPAGHLVLAFHHLLPMVDQAQFDTIRHGHPLYLSLHALVPALVRHGLRPMWADPSPDFGGSLVVGAARVGVPDRSVHDVLAAESRAGLPDLGGLRHLAPRARRSADALRAWLVQAAGQRRVLAYGAPSKACVLLGLSGVGPELLPFTADLSPAKHGRRIPGAGVPIRSPEELLAARPDDVLVLTWDLAEEVARQLRAVTARGGRLVLPVPEPHVLDIPRATAPVLVGASAPRPRAGPR